MVREFQGVPDYALEQREKLISDFSGLLFDEDSHTYTSQSGEILTPTSDMIKNFYQPFNVETVSVNYSQSRGLDINDVRGAWAGEGEIATSHGTEVHNFGEDYGNALFFEPEKEVRHAHCKQELGVIQWFNDRCVLRDKYIPLVFELKMFSHKYKYAGTADLILRDKKTGDIVIADYKTNKKNLKSLAFTTSMFPPFSGYRDTLYMKYTLQLSFYQILLEDMGHKVAGRELIWLNERKEQKSLYTPLFPQDTTKELRTWLESRKNFTNAQ